MTFQLLLSRSTFLETCSFFKLPAQAFSQVRKEQNSIRLVRQRYRVVSMCSGIELVHRMCSSTTRKAGSLSAANPLLILCRNRSPSDRMYRRYHYAIALKNIISCFEHYVTNSDCHIQHLLQHGSNYPQHCNEIRRTWLAELGCSDSIKSYQD